jgi:hypothetical protein
MILRTLKSFSLAAFLLLFVSCRIDAQNNPYVSWGEGQISDLRAEMHSTMTPGEIALDGTIKYRVVDASVFNAAAFAQGDRREIRVSAALLQVIDAYATMNTIGFLWNKPACSAAYDDYVAKIYNSNTVAVSEGLAQKGADEPFVYVRRHPDICPQIPPDVITNNERQSGDVRTVLIHESMKFVLLHEFAHHLYEDFDDVSSAESRTRESRADDFAFRHLLMSRNDSPLAALPLLMMFCSLEDFTKGNSESDHPSGVARVKAMIADAKGTAQWDAMWSRASPAQRQAILAALDELDEAE